MESLNKWLLPSSLFNYYKFASYKLLFNVKTFRYNINQNIAYPKISIQRAVMHLPLVFRLSGFALLNPTLQITPSLFSVAQMAFMIEYLYFSLHLLICRPNIFGKYWDYLFISVRILNLIAGFLIISERIHRLFE